MCYLKFVCVFVFDVAPEECKTGKDVNSTIGVTKIIKKRLCVCVKKECDLVCACVCICLVNVRKGQYGEYVCRHRLYVSFFLNSILKKTKHDKTNLDIDALP